MSAVLEIQDLVTQIQLKRSVVTAVDGVSLQIAAGETLGLVGESGCGKSMTAMSIVKLLPPGGRIAGGSVRINGREIISCDEREMCSIRGREVSVVFQDALAALNPTMTIGRQIEQSLRAHGGMSAPQIRSRAIEVLGLVGMPKPSERVDDYPHQLSGGMRQRVIIAAALANNPSLLIADEPTTALDVTIQAQIIALLDRLKTELKLAVLLVTHDLGVIAAHTDRVAVMYGGRIVEEATTESLFASTRHRYTEALLESLPRLDQDSDEELYSIPGLPPDLRNPPPGCRFFERCRYGDGRCEAESPALVDDGAGHRYSCHHPVGTAAARTEPAMSDVGPA